MMLVITISVLCLILETAPNCRHDKYPDGDANFTWGVGTLDMLHYTEGDTWLIVVELAATVVLSVELLLRLVAAPSICVRQPLAWVDLCGILPVWAALLVQILTSVDTLSGSSWITVNIILAAFRVLRLLQFLRLLHNYSSFRILRIAWVNTVRETLMLVVLIAVTAIFFGTILYYVEFSVEGLETIPQGLWFALVTITTVGYGDVVPTTPMGCIVATMCAIIGILVVATPIPIIADNFSKLYQARHMAQSISKKNTLRALIGTHGANPGTCIENIEVANNEPLKSDKETQTTATYLDTYTLHV